MLQHETVIKGEGKPSVFHRSRNVKNKNKEGIFGLMFGYPVVMQEPLPVLILLAPVPAAAHQPYSFFFSSHFLFYRQGRGRLAMEFVQKFLSNPFLKNIDEV